MPTPDAVPRHVAIIPDGSRRWARERGLTVFQGHERGVRIFEEVAAHAADRGVQHLSLWGLSRDNFTKRSPREVVGLMRIFRREFRRLAGNQAIHERQTRIAAFGQWRERFPWPVRRAIEAAQAATAHYSRHFLNFFLAYNGTDDMLQAVRGIVAEARRVPQRARFTVSSALLKQHLLTKDLPPVDLLIRTAGEPHLSAGFMMWDVADAQLYFTDKRWPEFTPAEFDDALRAYGQRQRRWGA
ncbi:MAG: di-trans,poly-cis-decaprenylcistransferase [Candidatus Andersenbacteria bacterium]|nr:di-trans,poly-cis-decaprenylcistransferase [Candidatus Andersenbacteria bacterium]